jgi:GNAT superfamily N-acetyltransferase
VSEDSIVVAAYRPELAPAFAALNRAWIEQFFRMEETDLEMLDDPDGHIISTGGQIFFALAQGNEPIGTVACVRVSDRIYELAKMAVSPSHQGRGIGELLGRTAIDHARASGADLIFLETNSRLANAIRLYERLGFAHAQRPKPSSYERSNVYMELRFTR